MSTTVPTQHSIVDAVSVASILKRKTLHCPAIDSRSSSREVKIRVPTVFWTSILVGESSPKKGTKGTTGGLRTDGNLEAEAVHVQCLVGNPPHHVPAPESPFEPGGKGTLGDGTLRRWLFFSEQT